MELSRKRLCRTIQTRGIRRGFYPHLQLRLNNRPLFNSQLLVDSPNATWSPKNVHLVFERASYILHKKWLHLIGSSAVADIIIHQ